MVNPLPPAPPASENRAVREKFESQKKVLQRMTLGLLEEGAERGLSDREAAVLRDALRELGWIPAELKV